MSLLLGRGWHPDPLRLLIAALLAPALVLAGRRHRRLGVVAVMAVAIGFTIGGALAENGDPPPASSPEYGMMIYLFHVAAPSVASVGITGGMMGTTVAIVDEARIDNAAVRVRRAICEGFRSRSLTHVVTVGGPDAAMTGRVLQKAVRWLPKYWGARLEILIVTPSPIPDNARKALQERGLSFREIEHEFPEPLPQGSLTRGQSAQL